MAGNTITLDEAALDAIVSRAVVAATAAANPQGARARSLDEARRAAWAATPVIQAAIDAGVDGPDYPVDGARLRNGFVLPHPLNPGKMLKGPAPIPRVPLRLLHAYIQGVDGAGPAGDMVIRRTVAAINEKFNAALAEWTSGRRPSPPARPNWGVEPREGRTPDQHRW